MHFDFFFAASSIDRLLEGLVLTVEITVWTNLLGIPLGFLIAILRTGSVSPLKWLASAYIEVFRCTPALLQIVWFFFCLPLTFGVTWSGPLMGVVVLTLNLAAFNAEAFRASIQALPRAQADASRALGLERRTELLLVILPQAVRNALPVLLTNGISMFQQSSLVSLVGVAELMYQGKLIASETYRPVEVFTLVALVYLMVTIPAGRLGSAVEHWNERYR